MGDVGDGGASSSSPSRRETAPAPGLSSWRCTTPSARWMRTLRILFVFLTFVSASMRRLLQHSFLIESFSSEFGADDDERSRRLKPSPLPLLEREWDRMLFGIFTYDSPNEREMREACRETHLSHFRRHIYKRLGFLQGRWEGFKEIDPDEVMAKNASRAGGSGMLGLGPDTICSLGELMENSTLARDPESCRVVYTFVMGGGRMMAGDNRSSELMRTKVMNMGRNSRDMDKSMATLRTRCLYGDPACGGTDIARWTLERPKCNASNALLRELESHDDVTLLSIPENHELGKTDTWYTYAAMLTIQRPDLQIGFVGKLDSDNFVKWPRFFSWIESRYRREVRDYPYLYGGYAIHRKVCSRNTYGYACAHPDFIADCFASGAFTYLSTPLVHRVYTDRGTSLERKREVWIVGEDMQLANMAYSDPTVMPFVLNHMHGQGGKYISTHCYNDPECMRTEYFRIFPKRTSTGLVEDVVRRALGDPNADMASPAAKEILSRLQMEITQLL